MRKNDKIRIAVLVALSSGRAVAGDVVFDGTTGPAGGAQFDNLTNTFSIREADGTLSGSNLFHSFSTFNIDVAETAEFSAVSAVNNVISRVTSFQPTTINGTVRSLIPNANFWFINPAGITVGATGVLDVQGAIALGSADFVEFAGGQQWHALTTTGGALAGGLVVNPTDFGFLPGSDARALSVSNQNFTATAPGEPQILGRSWLLTGGTGVTVTSSESLFLEDGKIETNRGGNVLVAGAGVEFRNTQIYAPRARVGIASVADPSTLVIDDSADFVFGAVPRESLRPIRFNDYEYAPGTVVHPFVGNVINTSSDSFVGGGVYLLGGEITLRSTLINSDSLQGSPADQTAKGIHVVGESLDLNRNTSLTSVVRNEAIFTADDDGIANDSPAEGDGGDITIDLYGDLTVSGTEDQSFTDGNLFHTSISSRTYSSGDGGNISINAANVILDGPQSLAGPPPTLAELALGGPAAGFIASSNDAVDRTDFNSRAAATGNAGDIDITLTGTLLMRGLDWSQGADPTDPNRALVIGIGGAQITSDTQHVGDLDDGLGNPLGTAGDITITARSMEIEGAGQISSSTSGPARGGNIAVTLTDGHLSMATDASATFTSGIFTRATSEPDNPRFGNAGNISIGVTAADPAEGYVTLSGTGVNGLGSRLFSDATFAAGDAGSISVDASGAVSLTGASVRTDVANSEDAFAGDVTLRSDSLVTIDSSIVSSQSDAANAAGNITVEGTGVLIRNRSQILADYNNAGSNPGEPGSINITATGTSTETQPPEVPVEARAGVVAVVDSGVTANNNGGRDDANRGDIRILADDIVIAGSVVSTDVVAGGVGDDIVIRGDRSVSLLRSEGDGFPLTGTVAAPDDPRGDIQRSLVSARTQASAAAGGLIRVEVGTGGTIAIQESNIDTSTSVDGSNANPGRGRSNIAVVAPDGTVRTQFGVVTTSTDGRDPAGDIQFAAERIEMDGSTIQAASFGSGDAGSINLSTTPGGSVDIETTSFRSDTAQAAALFDDDTGALVQLPQAGTIEINAGSGGAVLAFSNLASSAGELAGQAGTITINSDGALSMEGTNLDTLVRTQRTVDQDGVALTPAAITLTADGAISLFGATTLESETWGAVDAGSIAVTGSEVAISRSQISAATRPVLSPTTNTGNAGTVTLTATTGAVRLPDESTVSTESEGTNGGQAGVIAITGNGIEMNGAIVTTSVASSRVGLTPARIDLNAQAGALSLTDATLTAATSGTASAGNVTLQGNSIDVTGGRISTAAIDTIGLSTNLGAAGTIALSGPTIALTDTELSTSTDSDISSLVPAEIVIDATGGTLQASHAVLRAETTGRASAGNIQVTADRVQMGSSTVLASSRGSGDAGSINVAADTVQIDGTELRSDAVAGESFVDPVTQQLLQLANAGSVEINAGAGGADIDFSFLQSDAGEQAGQAGLVKVTSGGGLSMEGNEISTSVFTNRTAGPDGQPLEAAAIELLAEDEVSLFGTMIESETIGRVDAGSISVSGSELTISRSGISAATRQGNVASPNTGDAGSITLTATTGAVRLPDDSFISTSSAGPDAGFAGAIRIRGNGIEAQGATITTAVESTRNVGVQSPALIDLNSQGGALSLTGATLSAATSGITDAGTITLVGASIAVSGGSISVTTTDSGDAGSVTITTAGNVDLIDGASIESSARDDLTSTTDLGAAGTITVTGANVTLAGATLSTTTDSIRTSPAPAEIVLDAAGVLSLTDSNLSVATTRTVSAGDVTLTGASISMSGGSIAASTTSTGDAGSITIAADTGNVEITNGASVESSARDVATSSTNLGEAGTVSVTGANVTLAGATLSTSTDSDISSSTPAEIILDAAGTLSLTGTTLTAATTGAASAGNITLAGDSISVSGGSISATTTSTGDAGLVTLTADGDIELIDGASLESSARDVVTSSTNLGEAGTISVTGANITLAGASLSTSTDSDISSLTPAQIILDAAGTLSLTGATLTAATTGAASAGEVSLTGASISMSGGSVTASTTSTGDAGAITIAADTGDVEITNGASVESSARDEVTSSTNLGDAGTITVSGENITLAGANLSTSTDSNIVTASPAGIVLAGADVLSLTDSRLSAETSGAASAGNITLVGTSVEMSGGSISTSAVGGSSSETTLGAAGKITLDSDSITLANARLTTTTDSDVATLSAAGISLNIPGAISLTNTDLSASTTGAASAGNITLAGSSISMSGGSATASTTSTGNAGQIAITAAAGGDVQIINGADIATSSSGATSGAAGNIRVSGANVTLAADLSTSTGSDLTTLAPAEIDIDATGALSLTGANLSAATSGAADAGNITLDGASITMSGGSISASTTDLGDAGEVTLTAPNAVAVTNGASIETSSKGANSGEAGTIAIAGSSITLAGAEVTTSTESNVATTPARIDLTTPGALSLTNSSLSASTSGAASAGNITLAGSSVAMSGGSITASTTAAGNAGQVSIVAATGGNVGLTAGAQVTTSSSGAASGAAGTISVSGANVTLAGAGLSTSTGSDIATLAPAEIDIDATGTLSLTDTNVSAATSGAADAGNITLDGTSITMSGGSISASTTDLGDAGKVTLTAPNAVAVTNGASIETSSKGANSGEAGTIAITGSSITLASAEVTTSTESNVASTPARIDLTTPGALSLTNTNLSASTSGGASAGNIALTGSSIAMSGGTATARTTGAGDAGQVVLAATSGGVQVAGNATIETSSQGPNSGAAGTIEIGGSQITLSNSRVATSVQSNRSDLAAAQIDIATPGAVSLTGTTLEVQTSGAVNAGDININGASIAMNGGGITAATSGAGNAGRVTLDADGTVQISNNAEIETSSTAAGSGAAGTIDIDGSSISLANARIATSVASTRTGLTAAQITLDAPGAITLNNATLNAETSGAAAAGNVLVAGNSITMTDGEITARTTGAGNAGRVALASQGNLQISGGAVLQTSSVGATSGAAGAIDLHGSQVSLADTRVATSVESNVPGLSPAEITLAASGTMSLTDGTVVDATTRGAAPGGSIVITGSAILVEESSVSSQTTGAGDAGSICLAAGSNACTPDPDGRAQIFAAVIPGPGGITLADSSLSTSTSGSGSAGNVDVHASGTLLLSGATLQSSSTATSNAGNGGSINLSSGLSDELLFEDSSVQTNAVAAEGGDITLDGGGSVLNLQNSVLFASAGANGNGGDVTIDNVDTTLIQHSLILAQAERGNGGSILLTLQDGATFLQDSESLINADSQQGINGEVTINRPNTDLNSSIQPQEVDVSKPAELGTDVCAQSTPGSRSTFVREGRGGVAESPDSYTTSVPAAGKAPASTSASDQSTPVAKTAQSADEASTLKVTRGCL